MQLIKAQSSSAFQIKGAEIEGDPVGEVSSSDTVQYLPVYVYSIDTHGTVARRSFNYLHFTLTAVKKKEREKKEEHLKRQTDIDTE